ncbi:MAG: S26 family signal peptidase [Parvularculaceae bacterium]
MPYDGGEEVDLAKTVFYASIAPVLRIVIFQPFNIPSGSSEADVEVGDFVRIQADLRLFARSPFIR